MEFLSLSRRRPSAQNVPIGDKRGETEILQATTYFYFSWDIVFKIMLF